MLFVLLCPQKKTQTRNYCFIQVLSNKKLENILKMDDLIKFGLLCFTTYFTIINPLGVMPVFMTMTADLSDADRTATARKALITAFFTMVAFAFSGQLLFEFFGISADAFRVVGGIIFFMMGYDMLQARLIRTKMEEESVKSYVSDISVTPLAIPMICELVQSQTLL